MSVVPDIAAFLVPSAYWLFIVLVGRRVRVRGATPDGMHERCDRRPLRRHPQVEAASDP